MRVDLAVASRAAAIVLVEGRSDEAALDALAARRGLATGSDVAIIAMGGATNIGYFLASLPTLARRVRVTGLYDAAQEDHVRRALTRAGLGSRQPGRALEAARFYGCVCDLEDELIRALGPAAVEHVIAAQGELRPFRTFQKQPAHRGESAEQQLHRFMGTRSGRKCQYARALVEALDLSRVPRPLDAVLFAAMADRS
jgi:hypothetical protein